MSAKILNSYNSSKYNKTILLEKRWTIPDYTKFSNSYKPQQYSPILQKYLPWIYNFNTRVAAFRDQVDKDRRKFEKRYISLNIHRSSIIEDALNQLRNINEAHYKWRHCFKISFINEHGLSEAGIDQNGVFKEFMETLMTKLFSADFGLFKWTGVADDDDNGDCERCCYPSSLSYLHENHLELFKFAGQMLAKALYEGLVLDIPLAVFLLRHLLPKSGSATNIYSILDDLPLLDPILYKNLDQVRKIDNVEDLCLSFCFEENHMGQLKQFELFPGGKNIDVTNTNRIQYIHKFVNYKFNVQLKNQIKALETGFHTIIPKWLLQSFASPRELSRLMSGDSLSMDIDVDDLRKNIKYFGGFHSSHKVINWLFDVLKNDFKG